MLHKKDGEKSATVTGIEAASRESLKTPDPA
jgi:hypothetical protein